ncbi:uncharacterized protein BO80DRAFT_423940 [Aspergillus ibericus CBS 121593]|uniref:Uncharacterized protein n=1 Tax=Aspergillus ibericus CBS 121593 TaxID=1448316 RepID=A0A395H6N2_9EURO|nr:hypothetical protein BO80DRAFT_423940 [Aspergillus ibericus CBS 121593]RAL02528.1 hypothetical protein BO80DRAFT_423940 [Aspergillus ibericus CBS 121593]
MATDLDGDSQMASSPESSRAPSEDSHPGTRTPTNKLSSTRPPFGGSELSPPGSQPQTSTLGGQSKSFPPGLVDSPLATQTKQVDQQTASVASWMNNRAGEEYQRAMDYVIDQDFNLDEFGDPFDERDVEDNLF